MATRSRTSFQKRQKEIARAEKQRDKAAKRAARKLNPRAPVEDDEALLAQLAEAGEPGDEDGETGEPDEPEEASGAPGPMGSTSHSEQK
jgi:hypothetical protein